MDCPICMEKISGKANTLVTECGHCFHTKCMMTHVAHNGFGCPYCRAVMAEEPEYDDDESEYSDISEEENERDAEYILDVNEENRANDAGTAEYALRGMRLLFNRVEFDNECREEDDMEDQEPKPTVEFIAQKLAEQGVTFEQLVKVTLLEHDEYAYTREFDEISDDLFGKVRTLISNYVPEEAVASEPLLVEPVEMGDPFVTVRARQEQEEGQGPAVISGFSRDILISPECPELQSMNINELKIICRHYGIKTSLPHDQMISVLANIQTNLLGTIENI